VVCSMNAYSEIPSEVYEALRRASIRSGKDPATMVVESILKSLDPKSRVEIYMKLYERSLGTPRSSLPREILYKLARNIGELLSRF